ncbi:hypothetical protein JCM16106_01200 [Hydrogenophilus islandicus]
MVPTREELSRYLAPIRQCAPFAYCGLTPERLVVEVADPLKLTRCEIDALAARLARYRFAFYSCRQPVTLATAKAWVRSVGAVFGLATLDDNLLSDDDGITPITVHHEGERAHYIPYTDRPIQWHTDGYYNPPERTVRSLMLHALRPALSGGENRLLDPRIALWLLFDQDPELALALFEPDAMTIPPGRDYDGNPRGASVGPVFRFERLPDGGVALITRYTARKRNVVWADRPNVQAAKEALFALLEDADNAYVVTARLEAGMGLIGDNILHTREPFRDSPDPEARRLLLRARFLERITLP